MLAAGLWGADLGGTYKGTWTGAATGDFVITLTMGAGGSWSAAVVFSMGSEEVKTKVTQVKVDGTKVTIVYEFDLQGNALVSAISGELKDNTLAGTYKTMTPSGDAVDEGTWKASSER